MKGFKVIITILISLFVCILILFFFSLRINTFLKKEIKGIEKKISQARKMEKNLSKLKKEIAKLQKEMVKMERVIPINEIKPLGLIKDLALIAKEENLENVEIYCQDKPKSSPFDVENSLKKKSSKDNLKVVSLGVTLTFEGEYRNLLSFVKKIFHLERAVLIDGVWIERDKNILPRQKIKLELITYTFLKESESD